MRRLLIALAVFAAAPSAAQPGAGRGLFISPMGQPFRGGGGLAAWFKAADADGDGRITPEEFQADAGRYFKVLDVNKDGTLDGFELQAWEREAVPEIGGIFVGEGGPERQGFYARFGGRGERRGREGAGRFGLLDIPQPVQGSDRDVDHRVSFEEWTKTAALRFSLLDEAQAGVLTLETLPPLPGAPRPPKRR